LGVCFGPDLQGLPFPDPADALSPQVMVSVVAFSLDIDFPVPRLLTKTF
jgi:hypothetical protein